MVGLRCRSVTGLWKTTTKESLEKVMELSTLGANMSNSKDLCLTFVFLPSLLLPLCHSQPHGSTEPAGHVGPTILPYQGQVEGRNVPGRGTEVAWSALGVALPARRRQFSLPQQTNTFASGSPVLSGGGGRPSRGRSPEDYWKGQEVKRFYIHVGFNDLKDAFQQNLLRVTK